MITLVVDVLSVLPEVMVSVMVWTMVWLASIMLMRYVILVVPGVLLVDSRDLMA